jgi:hypothetical protein
MTTIDQMCDAIAEDCFRAGLDKAVMDGAKDREMGLPALSDKEFDLYAIDLANEVLDDTFLERVRVFISEKVETRRAMIRDFV